MYRWKILLFFWLLVWCQLKAQIVLKGKVYDEKHLAVPFASVILKSEGKERFLAFTTTNELGAYNLQLNSGVIGYLTVSSLGFQTWEKKIGMFPDSLQEEMRIILRPDTVLLNEVIVRGNQPIHVKRDTIIYDVGSFLIGNEQVLEDLLKKLPGIKIDSDGTVKVGNQEIEKIMIEGDDFFEKGYKLISKNMPINPIDKVELYQRYSNNKYLKGIESSDRVALNLRLKEDFKRTWFGNATGGFGGGQFSRYLGRSNVMNFGKKSKFYFLTQGNSLGEDGVSDLQDLLENSQSVDGSNIGINTLSTRLITMDREAPLLVKKRIQFNESGLLSLNGIFNNRKNWKIKTTGFISKDFLLYRRNSIQNFTLERESFVNIEEDKLSQNHSHFLLKAEVSFEPKENQSWKYNGKWTEGIGSFRGISSLNRIQFDEKLENRKFLMDQSLEYTLKRKENKVFILSGRYLEAVLPQRYSGSPINFGGLFDDSFSSARQMNHQANRFFGLEAFEITKNKNETIWEWSAGISFKRDQLVSEFRLTDSLLAEYKPDNFQNDLLFTLGEAFSTWKMRKQKKAYAWIAQLNARQTVDLKINRASSSKPFFLIPKIGLEWSPAKNSSVVASYQYNLTQIGILDIYQGYVQTNFRSFSKGAEVWNPLAASQALLYYSYGNWGGQFHLNSTIIYSQNHDFFSTNTFISPRYSTSEKILVKNQEMLSGQLIADYFIKPIQSNIKLTNSISKVEFGNQVNSSYRRVSSWNFANSIELRSGFSGKFNYHFGVKWRNQLVVATTQNSFQENNYFVDLTWQISNKWMVQSQVEQLTFMGLNDERSIIHFWDMEVKWILKENRLNFYFIGHNLLNNRHFTQLNISDVVNSVTQFPIIPRYILGKVEVRF